jgi:predicted O-methyltransferase YrrM
LFELYQRRGYALASGLNPLHWHGLAEAPFTNLIKDGASWTNGLGIALQEVYLLETLGAAYHPRRILVIGNSFGWSALAIALANPQAQIVAIDAGFDKNSLAGLELTNAIATEEGLRLRAVKAVSPGDIKQVAREFDGPIDFAFIDGNHTNEQIVLDWRAVREVAAPDAVYLFHDVHAWKLHDGIERIRRESGLAIELLFATPSGMALGYPPSQKPALAPALSVFAPGPEAIAVIEAMIWRKAHRHSLRWRRSLIKRGNRVRSWLGRPPLPLP